MTISPTRLKPTNVSPLLQNTTWQLKEMNMYHCGQSSKELCWVEKAKKKKQKKKTKKKQKKKPLSIYLSFISIYTKIWKIQTNLQWKPINDCLGIEVGVAETGRERTNKGVQGSF